MSIHGKVVAITGAASGIGRATAVALAGRGARLALSDVNEGGLAETAARCAGAEVTTTTLDVADREAVYAWADASADHFGVVNVILNNAGVALGASVEDLTYEDFEWLMGINFWGVVYGTKAFLPHLKRSGDGHVVNVSSVFGLIAVPCQSAYNAAKFAVRGFTEALAEEMIAEGAPVRVTSVHPGGIDTNIARAARFTPSAKWGIESSDKSAEEFKKLARTSPEEAAEQIIRAIDKGQRRLLIGKDAKVLDVVQRTFPALYQTLLARIAKRTRFGTETGASEPAERKATPSEKSPATRPETSA